MNLKVKTKKPVIKLLDVTNKLNKPWPRCRECVDKLKTCADNPMNKTKELAICITSADKLLKLTRKLWLNKPKPLPPSPQLHFFLPNLVRIS